MSAKLYTGSCVCGAVKVEARGEPYRVGVCHCYDCRKYHGAPFNAFAIFPADAVTVSGGTLGAYKASPEDARRFCAACGSPVCSGFDGADEIEVPLGVFDEIGAFTPTYELWIKRREPWLPEFASVRHRYPENRAGPGRFEE